MRCLGFLAAVILTGTGWAGQYGGVTGQYLEDRSNRVYGCACEWSSETMTQGREAVLAWKIVSGNYAGEDLSGLRLVAVLVGRFTLSDATTLRRSTVYVDLEAKESQRRAGVAWLRARFGDLLGEVLAVRDAPVVFRVDESAAELSVGNILEIRMRPADLILDTQAWASLLYEPFIKLTSATMATSLHNQYAGSELAIRWWRSDSTLSGITGYFGTFTTR